MSSLKTVCVRALTMHRPPTPYLPGRFTPLWLGAYACLLQQALTCLQRPTRGQKVLIGNPQRTLGIRCAPLPPALVGCLGHRGSSLSHRGRCTGCCPGYSLPVVVPLLYPFLSGFYTATYLRYPRHPSHTDWMSPARLTFWTFHRWQ